MSCETGKILLTNINTPSKCMSSLSQKLDQCTKSMATMETRSYEDAIEALNGLQTNAATVKKLIGLPHNTRSSNIKETLTYLNKLGITVNDLDKLSVIHVAGTKGKGSTCAMTESILRHLNVRTGFYSSPHLVNVTERIRLNGQPLSKRLFSQYFWKVYDTLAQTMNELNGDGSMPPYFKFLTVMAYYVFLNERIDVAVVEVGIGGEYDCTNVFRNTKTVGITSLGLDHTAMLGSTYAEIAWQKSGIIKPNCDVYTVAQPADCMRVINERAVEKQARLRVIPSFEDYESPDGTRYQQIVSHPTKRLNASLAIQLSYDWIRKNPQKIDDATILKHIDGCTLPSVIVEALANCYWPGRCQTLLHRGNKLFIDGAHTFDSMSLCANWFRQVAIERTQRKYLLFNVIGNRKAEDMLNVLHENLEFEEALFMPNVADFSSQKKDNLYTFEQPNRCTQHAEYWNSLSPNNRSQTFDCIADAFDYLDEQKMGNDEELTILVTGSLHLVGEVLRIVQDIHD